MSMEFSPAGNPAELALPYAEKLVMKGELDSFDSVSTIEQRNLQELEYLAEVTGMLNKRYFVNSGRSIVLPADLEYSEFTPYEMSDGIDFSGKLISFSTIRIGRNLGGQSIRALCLTFDNVTLLPYFEQIDSDRLVHTPAFAVMGIDELGAA